MAINGLTKLLVDFFREIIILQLGTWDFNRLGGKTATYSTAYKLTEIAFFCPCLTVQ